MILAAPLVIPFAKAVGISIGTLGMAALADQVNEYIQENPETSMKILSTLIPGMGINQVLMNKEKISLEDLDEMTDEEAQDLSKEEKAELMKQAGKSGSKDKRQTMIDISEKLGLSGEGKEKQDIEYDIDERYDEGGVESVSKPKFDYKKFFRNRRADGGAIGIEVLFEEKKPRKDFNIGGRATTQDFTEALRRVSAGTTNQQQAQAKEYARQEAANELSRAIQGGNLTNFLQGAGLSNFRSAFTDPRPGRLTPDQGYFTGSFRAARDQLLDKLVDKKLDTTFFGSNFDPMKEEREALEKIKLENQRLFDEYIKNNPPQLGVITGPTGKAPTKPTPPYEDQTLLDKLTMLTPLQATNLDPFDQLSDLDQYNLSLAFPELKSQLRNPNAPRLAVMPDPQDLFSTRYGIVSGSPMIPNLKNGGRVGLFMGGPALTGTALDIYNSMKAYGFTDEEIANSLRARGLYDTTPAPTTPAQPLQPNITRPNGGGKDENDNVGVKDPYGGLGFSSSNFGLGKGINKDAVMDYEADAYQQGRTLTGQLNKIGLGIFSALKNLPTPFNLVRKGIEFAKQKELEKQRQEEAIARDNFREAMKQGRGFYDQFGKGGAQASKSREEAGTGYDSLDPGSPFKDGGRIGFRYGGGADASKGDFGGTGGGGGGGGEERDPRSDYMGMKGKTRTGPGPSQEGLKNPLITIKPVIPTTPPEKTKVEDFIKNKNIPSLDPFGLQLTAFNRARIKAMLNPTLSILEKTPVGDVTIETAIGPVSVTGTDNLRGQKNLGLSTGIGPVGLNLNTDLAGTNNLGIGFSKGPLSVTGSTNLSGIGNIGLQYSKSFKDGGLVTMFAEKK